MTFLQIFQICNSNLDLYFLGMDLARYESLESLVSRKMRSIPEGHDGNALTTTEKLPQIPGCMHKKIVPGSEILSHFEAFGFLVTKLLGIC